MAIRMRLISLSMILLPAALFAQAQPAPVPAAPMKPTAEHHRLDAFVGTWNTEGQAQESPYGPAGKFSGTDTFEWLPGGFFLSHRWESRQGSAELKGLEIIGYDGRNKAYTSRFFDNLGNAGSLRGRLQANAWTWTGDSDVAGKPLKERCTLIVVRPDTFTNKCEYSLDGAKWLINFEVRSTRATQ